MKLGATVQGIAPSGTAELQALSKRLQEEGRKVNSALLIGEPDYAPPPQVLAAVGEAATKLHTRYTVVQGDTEIRGAICGYLSEKKGVQYKPDQICVSNGAKQSVYQAFLAVLDEGDEVLIPTPCWTSYHDMARLCRAAPVSVDTHVAEGYLLKPEALEEALRASSGKCKALVLCNPNNPTGAVLPEDALEALAAVLRKPEFAHVYVLADEIYEQLTFDTKHVSFASLDGMQERTLLVGGFSKGWAMTGFRLGYLAASKLVASAAVKLQSQITSCASSLSQYAGVVALRDVPAEWFAERVEELRKKRDIVFAKLRDIPGVTCCVPQGAFYVLPDLSKCLGPDVKDTNQFCNTLLNDYGVAMMPGSAFKAPTTVRISYAATEENIQHGMDAFAKCLLAMCGSHANGAAAAKLADPEDAGEQGGQKRRRVEAS